MKKDFTEVLPNLEKMVNQLIDKCEYSMTRAEEAEQKVNVLEQQLREKNEKIAALEKNAEALKLGKSVTDNAESKEIKQRVNELVNEVDRCIALLND